MENEVKNVVPKVSVEEFAAAPETIELLCRSGFENIEAQDNEDGLQDYAHVKLDKGFVTYKIVGAHKNDVGQVALSFRKIKATQIVVDPAVAAVKDGRKAEIMAEMEKLSNELQGLCF